MVSDLNSTQLGLVEKPIALFVVGLLSLARRKHEHREKAEICAAAEITKIHKLQLVSLSTLAASASDSPSIDSLQLGQSGVSFPAAITALFYARHSSLLVQKRNASSRAFQPLTNRIVQALPFEFLLLIQS